MRCGLIAVRLFFFMTLCGTAMVASKHDRACVTSTLWRYAGRSLEKGACESERGFTRGESV